MRRPTRAEQVSMTPSWSGWKHYPKGGRGNIEAPIGPGLYEVRRANDGALFAFDVVDNLAKALAALQTRPKRLGWFGRRGDDEHRAAWKGMPMILKDLLRSSGVRPKSRLHGFLETLAAVGVA